MIQKTFTATLDVKRGVIETPIVVVRGDTGNVFKLRVQDDGADVDLTGASVVVAFRGPGGAWTQDIETGGVTVSGAEVTFPVFKDSVSEGTNSCDVQIYSEEPGGIPSLVTTAAFTFECRAATVGEDSIRADASLPILLELIRQMSEAADKFPRIDVEAIPHGHRIVITNYDETEYTCDVMDGVSGVYVGSGAMPEGYNVQIDPDGGESGIDWSDIENKPEEYPPEAHAHEAADITDFPTGVSAFENDAGYLTEHQDISGKVNEPASEGTNGQVLATDGAGTRFWKTVSGGGGETELYFCTYGTTTFAEITAALAAGKLPVCIYNDVCYQYAGISNVYHCFTAILTTSARRLYVKNTWGSASYNIQENITDLAEIRSGAALGATALQEHQSLAAYRTSSAQDVIDAGKLAASAVTHETWTFTLDDDSTVDKEVVLWQ